MGNNHATKRIHVNGPTPVKPKKAKRKSKTADIAHPPHIHSATPYPNYADDSIEKAPDPIPQQPTNKIKAGDFVGDIANHSTGGSMIGTAVPFGPANIKVYRSYSNARVEDISTPELLRSEGIRVYKKRADHLTRKERRSDPGQGLILSDYPELRKKANGDLKLKQLETIELCDDALSTCDSDLSPDGRVTKSDFPTAEKREERLSLFATSFTSHLKKHLDNLSLLQLLSRLPVAEQDHQRRFSAKDFIEAGSDLPRLKVIVPEACANDLVARRARFRSALLKRQSRGEGGGVVGCCADDDAEGLRRMSGWMADEAVAGAAVELSRVYEYQIVLIEDEESMEMLASHAAACAFQFANQDGNFFDSNAFVEGVVQHKLEAYKPRFFQIKLGRSVFIWQLDWIFKKPGVRFDNPLLWHWAARLKTGQDVAALLRERKMAVRSTENAWGFYADEESDVATYGYRSVVLKHDKMRENCCFGDRERKWLGACQLVRPKPSDCHRLFVPSTCLLNRELQYLDLKAYDLVLTWANHLGPICRIKEVSLNEDQQGLLNNGKPFLVGTTNNKTFELNENLDSISDEFCPMEDTKSCQKSIDSSICNSKTPSSATYIDKNNGFTNKPFEKTINNILNPQIENKTLFSNSNYIAKKKKVPTATLR